MPRYRDNSNFSLSLLRPSQGILQCCGLIIQIAKVTLFITIGLSFLLLSEAIAEETNQSLDLDNDGFVDVVLNDWDFTLGAGVGIGPDYEGSDDYEIGALPIIEASWRDDTFFISSESGIGATLLRSEHFSSGLAFNYDGGREDGDNSALRGLGDIDDGINVTAFAGLDFGQYALGVDVTQDLSGDDKGTLVTLGADYRFSFLDDKLMFELGPEVSWASDDYMNTYFGVDGKQAARSKYNQFDADAGFKDIGLHLNAMYDFDENWAITGGIGYARLLGDAADSPFVESKDQFFSLFAVSYSF